MAKTDGKKQRRPVRVGLISLGCAKNLVDAEIMLGALLKSGIEITNDAAGADVVIVNTCSFIDAAQEESIDAILESDELRKAHHPAQGLIVSGCMPQRFREALPKLLPEVDAFMGIDQAAEVPEIVERVLAHRKEKLSRREIGLRTRRRSGAVESNGKREIARGLAELHPPGDVAARHRDHEHSLRGSGTFGRTKKVLGPEHGTDCGSSNVVAGSSHEAPFVRINLRPTYIPDYATPRFRLTPRHFAYVKIAEGCNHPCSFCTIPRMRGAHRSRPQSDVVREARQLLAEGVKELNLISQDSTYYGLDLRPDRAGSIAAPEKFTAAARALPANATTLCTLLRELNELPGEFWIRLLYTHPAHWTDELIRTIAECPKVARYVDMPLQHIHGAMLERMRRETSQEHIVRLIERMRAGLPGLAIRTTFIVGFPGETEDYFEELLSFIRTTRFERLGVFAYSKEEGTRAGNMGGQISDAVKRRRRERAMAAQLGVAREVARSFVGRTLRVLVERETDGRDLQKPGLTSWEHGLIRSSAGSARALRGKLLVARAEADAPDIDGRVYVRGHLPLGEFAQVKIVGHTDYDLLAEPAG